MRLNSHATYKNNDNIPIDLLNERQFVGKIAQFMRLAK